MKTPLIIATLGLTMTLAAQNYMTTFPLDIFKPEAKAQWDDFAVFAQDPDKGNILSIDFPARRGVGGIRFVFNDDIPKCAEWEELRFDYKISHPKEWFGVKIVDKPIADGWQATWLLTVPENANTTWQTAIIPVNKPMWRWGTGPSDERSLTFRFDHETDEAPFKMRIANLKLVRRILRTSLANDIGSVIWNDARHGSVVINCINSSQSPLEIRLKATSDNAMAFEQTDSQHTVVSGSSSLSLPFTVRDNLPSLTPISFNISVLSQDGQTLLDALSGESATPAPTQPSPCLLFTRNMLPEIIRRTQETDGGKQFWEKHKKISDIWLEKDIVFPPRGSQWWHWYSCKKCGTNLKTEGPTRHVCPNCKAVYSGWPYDDVVLDRDHFTLAGMVRDLGLTYQITKDVRYAAKAREILMGYAERYLKYPLHDINGNPSDGGGHITPQTLDESVWSIPMLQGFDCIRETLSQEDIDFMARKMFLPCAYHIKRHQWGIHNICCWHASAYGLAGLVFNRPDLIQAAIFGPKGIIAQLEKGVTEDGPWYERSWGYHFYTLNALRPLACAIHNTAITEVPKRYKLMFDAPLKFLSPTYQLPAFHDSPRVGFSFSGNSYLYEISYAWWRDPNHGAVAAQGNHASLEALLYGASDIKSDATSFKSENYADSGNIVLRSQSPALMSSVIPSNFICLDYGEHGGGHGHPDKLNFVLYAHDTLIAEDPGCIAYGNPAHEGWYRQTLSHNTIVVDGKSQWATTGSCLAFATAPNASVCLTDAGKIAANVTARRAMAMVGDMIFDILWAESPQSHQYEYAFHARGTLETTSSASATETPAGDGYKWATDWQLLAPARMQRLLWKQDTVQLALTLTQGADNGETRIAIGMGNPPTVKPPFVLSRLNGTAALFGGVYQLARPADAIAQPDVTVTRNGSAVILKAQFADGNAFVLTADPTATSSKVSLVQVKNGTPVTIVTN